MRVRESEPVWTRLRDVESVGGERVKPLVGVGEDVKDSVRE